MTHAPRIQNQRRFNVLITEDRPHESEHWTRQLPRLMAPMGVTSWVVSSGREAMDCATRHTIHAAVVDIATPYDAHEAEAGRASSQDPAGVWLMQLMRRLPNNPPLVVVQRQAYSDRQIARALNEALKLGAFSVINKPVNLETLLDVFRRLLEKEYHGHWPTDRKDQRDQEDLK